jgi:ribulose-5-phosphate 4-epimerase/fuculose-1-phosphate aldolase
MSDSSSDIQQLRESVALSCRILAATGCVREITGHVSMRVPDTQKFVVRCRPPHDPGVQFTIADDIHLVDLDTTNADLQGGYALPGEWSIHTEIYRSRSDVGAVVHGHPRSSLLVGILGLPLTPTIGAYDPGAMELAVRGVPIYERAVLIDRPERGAELVAAMEDKDVCLMRGHGVVAVGATLQEATVRAIKLETLADLTLATYAVPGARPIPLTQADADDVAGFVNSRKAALTYAEWTWDYYRHTLGSVADVGIRL